MQTEVLSDADCVRAQQVWADYQATHDVSRRHGQAVGVDPHTGEVFFGETSTTIHHQLKAEGRARPLVCWRVGFPYYGRMRERYRRWSADR